MNRYRLQECEDDNTRLAAEVQQMQAEHLYRVKVCIHRVSLKAQEGHEADSK